MNDIEKTKQNSYVLFLEERLFAVSQRRRSFKRNRKVPFYLNCGNCHEVGDTSTGEL